MPGMRHARISGLSGGTSHKERIGWKSDKLKATTASRKKDAVEVLSALLLLNAFNFFGDALRDVLDPKLRGTRGV